MSKRIGLRGHGLGLGVMWAALAAVVPAFGASQIVMKDGRTFEGRVARVASMGDVPTNAPADGAPQVLSIVLCDDDLRRIFVPNRQILTSVESPATPLVSFNIRQYVAKAGGQVAQLGAPLRITDFDEFGRRIFTMNSNQGKIDVVQGITKITPVWTKVEALHMMQGKNFMWDMRLATSSIPPDTLRHILAKQINEKKIEERLKLVTLFLQGDRYQDAQVELNNVIQAFPDSKQRFEGALRDLKQQFARRLLNEIEVRGSAGQHKSAINMLQNFPVDGVAGETVQAVKQSLDEYRIEFDRYNEILKQLDDLFGKLTTDERKPLEAVFDEMKKELNVHTLGRMASFRQFWSDPALSDHEKIALAVSGWLVGSDDALRKLPVAASLYEVRNLVRRYLAEPAKLKRNQLLVDLAAQEGATPELVAKILRYMLPPLETKAPEGTDKPSGLFELSIAGAPGEAATPYYVQVPPEYDPHRLYPTIVTLHGAGTTPLQQIDWWAGSVGQNGERFGHATRYGYIVIAPAWAKEGQLDYEFSAAEHGAVLNSLRDACRRFSVDTDRVFISGHSMGGDAAWDLGLSHPDLWAGVIPVVARADKYISLLWENLKHVPFYLVGGELDGDKSKHNSRDLDRYMTHYYNATVVEYQGRGHEHFSDEILRLFDWMNRFQRDFFPKEFTTASMRPWDNYFWWLELDAFTEKTMVEPEEWPKKGARPAKTKATANASNGLVVNTGAKKGIIWLSPELINFRHKITLSFNGGHARLPGQGIEPSLNVLLEDARTRADRQHPFWAKIEMPAGRINDGEGDSAGR
ncbi:MAG TPA: peptidase [Pirellulales bacterium]|nr:peptidase [Pirellulales bacterium]